MMLTVDAGEILGIGKTAKSVAATVSFCSIGIKDAHLRGWQEPDDTICSYAVATMAKTSCPGRIKVWIVDENKVVAGALPFFKV